MSLLAYSYTQRSTADLILEIKRLSGPVGKSLRRSFHRQMNHRIRVRNVEKCLRQVMALLDGEDIV